MERHGGTETESGDNQRTLKLAIEPVQRGKNIADFCVAVVCAFAQAGATKVEAQNGKAQAPIGIIKGLHGVVNNLVVQIAAVKRMRVADEGGERERRMHPHSAPLQAGQRDRRARRSEWRRGRNFHLAR